MDKTLRYVLWLALLLVPFMGVGCARAARGFGRQIALTWLTNTASVIETIARQVRAFGKTGLLAILFVVGVVGLFLFTPTAWGALLGSVVGFAANLALGLSSGIGINACEILAKPDERDSIDAQLDMKRRTRRRLQKFLALTVVGLLLQGALGSVYAGDSVWVMAIDESDSMDPAQREVGIDALVRGAPDRARQLGVTAILVLRFSQEELLSDMTWVPVPPSLPFEDCRRVVPEFVLSKGLVGFSPTFAATRKQQAVDACLARQESERRSIEEQDRRLQEQLRIASRLTPRGDVKTRIVALLKKLVARPYVRAIDVLTDGIDNSGIPPSTLHVPEGISVTLIIGRPNPNRQEPTLNQVLAAAEAWDRIEGVSVTTVSEYSGFSDFAEAR